MNAYKVIDDVTLQIHFCIAHGASCAYEIVKQHTKQKRMTVCTLMGKPINIKEDVAYG